MRTTIVCGLLGSGKTTFIQNTIAEADEKTVVLVNDFGKSGIDGEVIENSGLETVELPSGCICCTLRVDLDKSISSAIEQFHPEHLVIEPSGVASPSAVLEVLENMDIQGITVVGMIDGVEFLELYRAEFYGPFFKDQVASSDVLILNKTDITPAELLDETQKELESINPRAVIIRAVKAKVSDSFEEFSGRREKSNNQEHPFDFETVSIELPSPYPYDKAVEIIKSLSEGKYGNAVRAKALIKTEKGPRKFDLTFGKIDETTFDGDIAVNRLVVIGSELDRDALQAKAHKIIIKPL